MRVSIIISVYNCLEMTKKCLQTLDDTMPEGLDYELILVDDGSTDGSRDFLKEYSRKQAYCSAIFNEKNLGFAQSNNRAVDLSNGTHLLFLNNDTELTQGWMEPMLEAYKKLARKNVGIVGNVQRRFSDKQIDHAGVYINARGKPDHLLLDPVEHYPKLKYSEQLAATGACILMPAELFRSVGGFDTEFQNGGEDMDLNFKVRQAGYRVFVANRSCIWHHVSASPGRNNHHERNTRIVFRKWRDLLLEEGANQWAIEYASLPENKGKYWANKAYRQCMLFKKGWKSHPPKEAYAAVEALIFEQEAVWEKM